MYLKVLNGDGGFLLNLLPSTRPFMSQGTSLSLNRRTDPPRGTKPSTFLRSDLFHPRLVLHEPKVWFIRLEVTCPTLLGASFTRPNQSHPEILLTKQDLSLRYVTFYSSSGSIVESLSKSRRGDWFLLLN